MAAANPDKVAALEKRANELAATLTKPLLLEAEFEAMKERLSLPPALPDEGDLRRRGPRATMREDGAVGRARPRNRRKDVASVRRRSSGD